MSQIGAPDHSDNVAHIAPKDVKRSATQQDSVIPRGWKPTASEPVPVVRCTSMTHRGERCKRWSVRGVTVCPRHGGRLPNVESHAKAVVEAARLRIIGLADSAIDQIEDLMQNASGEAIRLKAAQDVLDRASVRGAIEVEVTHSETESASDRINRRLSEIAERNTRANSTALTTDPSLDNSDDIIDAEIEIEDLEDTAEEVTDDNGN